MSRFENAVGKLITSFLQGDLQPGKGCSCAVGNLLDNSNQWTNLFMTTSQGQQINKATIGNPNMYVELKERIKSTGYTIYQMAEVERTFEEGGDCEKIYYCELTNEEIIEDQFKRLCAVFDKLAEFDDIDPEPFKEQLKQKPELC